MHGGSPVIGLMKVLELSNRHGDVADWQDWPCTSGLPTIPPTYYLLVAFPHLLPHFVSTHFPWKMSRGWWLTFSIGITIMNHTHEAEEK